VRVTIRLFATFRDLSPKRVAGCPLAIDIDEHETVRGLIKTLRLPDEVPRIVLVNGLFTPEDAPLYEGDIVSIFPPLIGGRH
jgi:molybdopterin converting factor small subunit